VIGQIIAAARKSLYEVKMRTDI